MEHNKAFIASIISFFYSIAALVLLYHSLILQFFFKRQGSFVSNYIGQPVIAPLLLLIVIVAISALISGIYALRITKDPGRYLLRGAAILGILIGGWILLTSVVTLF